MGQNRKQNRKKTVKKKIENNSDIFLNTVKKFETLWKKWKTLNNAEKLWATVKKGFKKTMKNNWKMCECGENNEEGGERWG